VTDLMPEPVMDLDTAAGGAPGGTAGGPDVLDAIDEQLLDRLVGQARAGGLQLTGEGGLLAQLTKRLVESALEGEITATSATAATMSPAATAGTPATATAPRPS
jgi:putative transposase